MSENVDDVTVAGSTTSENVALTALPVDTPDAPSAGDTDVTVGGVVSIGVGLVVTDTALLAGETLPAASAALTVKP